MNVMNRAGVLIGNGCSRSGFDLEKLRCLDAIYGCNALHRDFHPDVLVASDMILIDEIRSSDYSGDFVYLTENGMSSTRRGDLGINFVGDSGITALRIMCQTEKLKTIYLLGVDCTTFIDKEGTQVNNIYAGTRGYGYRGHLQSEPEIHRETLAIPREKSYAQVFRDYPDIEFVQVNNRMPNIWERIRLLSIDNFLSECSELA